MKHENDIYAERFADYLNEAMERTGMSKSQVARSAHVSRQTIGQMANKTPNTTTGKLIMPARKTVDAIAKAFGDPIPKARLAAGYAPINSPAESVEQALDATLYWDQKGLSNGGKKELRLLMEALDNAAEQLAMRSPKKIVDITEVESDTVKVDRRN